MKCIWLVLLLAMIPALDPANEEKVEMIGSFGFQEGMATIVVDGKYGYIDTRGKRLFHHRRLADLA